MAAARSAAPSRAARPARRPARRAVPSLPTSARNAGIRWDRMGRVAMLLLVAGVLSLYAGPVHSWYVTWRDSRAKRAEVARLRAENVRLRARRADLLRASTLEREARRLGMVRPGERPYIVRGLPRGP
jgi:cell division protein FtsB